MVKVNDYVIYAVGPNNSSPALPRRRGEMAKVLSVQPGILTQFLATIEFQDGVQHVAPNSYITAVEEGPW